MPTWIDALERAHASGGCGAELCFNTSDRVIADIAGAPVVSNLKYFLAAKYAQAGYTVAYFSLATGMTELRPPSARTPPSSAISAACGTESPLLAMRALETSLRNGNARLAFLIDYADHLAPAGTAGQALAPENIALLETLHSWSLDDEIRMSGNVFILISREDALHGLLRQDSGLRRITVALPDLDARQRFTRFLLDARETCGAARLGHLDDSLTPESFAVATSGLKLNDIERLLLAAGAAGKPVTLEQVHVLKREVIGQMCHGLLEVIEPDKGFEAVAGCDTAKDYFRAIAPLWQVNSSSLPQGVLLVGVPGTGKSFLVKALAKELGCPLLAMRNVREQWVGQSERNLERVLNVVDSLAPCILWTDEIDQQGMGDRSGGPSGDSGVSQRMMARLLEFFGDARVRGRVLWIATTNRPDLLDVAIADRFSVKIPFLHPTASERAALLPVLAVQAGRQLGLDVQPETIGLRRELEMATVRSLHEIIVWAGTLADMGAENAHAPIAQRHLERAVADYKPSFNAVEHELIALIALRMTTFQSLMPWSGFRAHEPGAREVPAYLHDLVDGETGRLDSTGLERRIQELQNQRFQQKVNQ